MTDKTTKPSWFYDDKLRTAIIDWLIIILLFSLGMVGVVLVASGMWLT